MDTIWAEYQRTLPPDEKNSFLVVEAAAKERPTAFSTWAAQPDALLSVLKEADSQPGVAVTAKALAECRKQLDQVRPALEIAHILRRLDGPGAGPTKLGLDGIGVLIPHVDSVHRVLELLEVEGTYTALTNDPERAFVAAICCVQAGRSLGDEPFWITQMVRLKGSVTAARIARLTLARIAVREELLAELQTRLTAELDPNRFLRVWMMERASLNQVYQNFRDGRDTVRAFVARYGLSVPGPVEVQSALMAVTENGEHLTVLEHMNEVVAVARAPEEQRVRLAARILPLPLGHSIISKLLSGLGYGGPSAHFERELTSAATIRTAVVALACERHRLRTGAWPKALSELPPPLQADPFTGQPLKYKLADGGAVVYSVGPDGEDNGGQLRYTHKPSPGSDGGFPLVDPIRRTK